TTAAASSSQLRAEPPMGPTSNRSSSLHPGADDEAPARPNTDRASWPASTVPTTHGADRTAATTVEETATHSARTPPLRSPTSSDPTTNPAPQRTTTTATAGARATATPSR